MSVFDEDVVFILIYEFTYTYIQAKKDTHILSKKKEKGGREARKKMEGEEGRRREGRGGLFSSPPHLMLSLCWLHRSSKGEEGEDPIFFASSIISSSSYHPRYLATAKREEGRRERSGPPSFKP